jgi:ElaB/YqjD/DUF883 family membrane-anchored ribosome-binding protein
MGERTDQMRRDTDPLADPAGRPEEAIPVTGPDLGVGGGAVVDEGEATRVEIERSRAEIERTRADMGETVDAIQGRLSPENLKEQAKDRVREATVGRAQEAGSTVVETIRENPLPTILTTIGLSWLFMSARRQSSAQQRYEELDPAGPSAGQAVERARDKVGETAGQVQDKAEQVAEQAQDRAGRLGDQALHQARRATGGFQQMLQENPLTVGALAVATGAAVGLAIPETSREHEVMGEARDTLVEKAQEKAQDAQQRVQRVAEEAQSAARDEAENQGLTDQ